MPIAREGHRIDLAQPRGPQHDHGTHGPPGRATSISVGAPPLASDAGVRRMGCGDGRLLNDEGYRAIEGSSRLPLINYKVTRPAGPTCRGGLCGGPQPSACFIRRGVARHGELDSARPRDRANDLRCSAPSPPPRRARPVPAPGAPRGGVGGCHGRAGCFWATSSTSRRSCGPQTVRSRFCTTRPTGSLRTPTDDVVAVEDGAGLVADQEHGDAQRVGFSEVSWAPDVGLEPRHLGEWQLHEQTACLST